MVKRTKRPVRRDHEIGSGNIYADLGYADPESLLIKAKLVTKIGEIIAARELTQAQAAYLLEIPQPKLSNLLKGRFRGFSERKLMDLLRSLGHDVEIVVRAAQRARGSISVSFPG